MIKEIEKIINQLSNLNVLVIGETIIDEFIEVIYEGQSMKSFCPVFRFAESKKKIQYGGAAAIVGHLKDFVKRVDLITNENNEIIKTRFVDKEGRKKHVELNKISNSNFKNINVNSNDYDVVIVADFGHGFCDRLKLKNGFHLMCQTNSNNFGFNRLSKWKSYEKQSVCLDLREASLQINDRIEFFSDIKAIEVYNYEINCKDLFVTLGKKGSLHTQGDLVSRQQIFKSNIVDTIGAGDTFFAFSSLMSDLNIYDKLLIPSLAASLSTTWLCNEESITKEKLITYANQHL